MSHVPSVDDDSFDDIVHYLRQIEAVRANSMRIEEQQRTSSWTDCLLLSGDE